MLQLSGSKPIPGVMFGLTHDIDGAVIIREPRILKVGIGLPRGRALNVWIHNDGKWYFRVGNKGADNRLKFETVPKGGLETRAEAERFYRENYTNVDLCNYPRKLGFFTFTRPVIDDSGTEVFEPDFDAIEAHGVTPTAIDIVFLDDNPFDGAYQMWSSSECRCKGDGINALRVLSMAANPEEKKLADEAKKAGEKYFPIIGGCWTNGCSYSKETTEGTRTVSSLCKPGADLKFQLARNIRVGGTAYFHTSGMRSITQTHSSLERIKSLTNGRLAGIPLKMVLRPYKTNHNGQAATQYGVSLEFRAEDIESLRKNLMEQAWKFRQVVEPGQRRLLDAPAVESVIEDDDDSTISAQAMADEFYADESGSAEDPPPVNTGNTAATATDAKTADLAEKLKAKASAPRKTAAPEPAPATPTQAAPTSAPVRPQPQTGDMF
jgi:hypothetical protein